MSSSVKKQSFLKGALILTISGFLVKIIGFIYKIPLTNIVGEEAMGYYNSALTIYTTMYVLATAGLPVTVSRMIASATALKKYKDPAKILKIALLIYSSASFLIAIFMLIFSDTVAGWTGNLPASHAMAAVAPAVFFVSAVAALRGYFQGFQNMVPTSVSNILESFSNMIIGFSLALILLKSGYPLPIVAAGAVTGVSVSAAISLLYMLFKYFQNKKSIHREFLDREDSLSETGYKSLAGEFLKASVPILIGSLTMNLTNTIDVFVLINRLVDSGLAEKAANIIYGSYTSMAVLLYNMPATITIAICTSALPTLAKAYTLKQPDRIRSAINASFRMNALVAFPAAIGMAVMALPILSLLYPSRPNGVAIAAPLLSILGFAVIPLSIATVSTSMLQAIKKPHIPVINIFIAGVVKFLLNFFMIATPSIRIKGAPIATLVCYLLIATLNLWQLKRNTGMFPDIKMTIIKPLISALGCGITAYFSYKFFNNFIPHKLSTVVSIALGAVIYVILLFLVKGITLNDINLLPFGKKIKKVLENKGKIR